MQDFLTASGGSLWTVGTLLKGTTILMLAWLITLALRHRSAALRHLVWSAGLLALLALPFLSATLPWHLPVTLPQRAVAVTPPPAPSRHTVQSDQIIPEAPASLDQPASAARSTPAAGAAAAAPAWSLPSWPVMLLGIWLAGVALLLGRLAIGGLVVARLRRRARRLDASDWTRPLAECADRLELDRLPDLLLSDRLPMPFACGLLRPAIVLPAGADEWDDRRRRAVLCHELAHLRRLDLPVNLLGQIAIALHWFNPLVWIAVARVRVESERACDDLVLGAGTRPSEYADHLLQIVCRAARSRPPAVVLPMAHRREFEGRMLAILERDAKREPLTRRGAAGLAAMTLALVLPLAALVPAASTGHPATPEALDAGSPAQPKDPAAGVDGALELRNGASLSLVTDTRQQTATRQSARQDTHTSSSQVQPTPTPTPAPMPAPGGTSSVAVHVHLNRAAADTSDPRVVSALLKALEDSVADVRASAAFALGQLELRSSAAPLAARLGREQDAKVRSQIVWALGQIESNDAVPALAAIVRGDSSDEVREKAVWALGQIEDSSSVPALVAALGDRVSGIRAKAAWALGQIEPRHAPPALVAALRDPSAQVRKDAAWALGQIEDTTAVPGLAAALSDSTRDVRRTALWALGQMDSRAAQPALMRALDDADPEVRAEAARALGNSGN